MTPQDIYHHYKRRDRLSMNGVNLDLELKLKPRFKTSLFLKALSAELNLEWNMLSTITEIVILYFNHHLSKCLPHPMIMIHVRFLRLTLFLLTKLAKFFVFLKFIVSYYCWSILVKRSSSCWVWFVVERLLSAVTFLWDLSLTYWQLKGSALSAIGQINRPGVEFWT